MKLVDRYLLREYCIPIGYCLITFSMIFVIYDLFDNLSKFLTAQTPWSLVLVYYACLLAPSLELLVPAALLLATLYTLWQLTRHNELMAFRTSGISLMRMMTPFLLVGLAFTLLTAIVKETVAPRAARWAADFTRNDFQPLDVVGRDDQHYYNSIGRRQWHIGRFDLRNPRVLRRVTVDQEGEDGLPDWTIAAKTAEWLDGEWWFFDVLLQEYNALGYPVGTGDRQPGSRLGVPYPEFDEHPQDFRDEVRNWELLSTTEKLRFLQTRPNLSVEEEARKWFDIHHSLAMPWACFIVTLFGIPAGARQSRQSALAGIFLAVAFFFGFYALTQVGVLIGKGLLVWPWLGAWLSNIVFLALGLQMVKDMH
jgi:lipopolysaccharide export system permease protein